MFGTVHLKCGGRSNAATVRAVATHLSTMLNKLECSNVSIEGNRVRFRNNLFGGSIRFSWGGNEDNYRDSFLGQFSSGMFDIDAAADGVAVRYRLNGFRLWITTAIMIVILIPRFHTPISINALWQFPLLPIIALATLYYISIWFYVAFWLRRELDEVNDLSMKV
jgi:hypothetical protein